MVAKDEQSTTNACLEHDGRCIHLRTGFSTPSWTSRVTNRCALATSDCHAGADYLRKLHAYEARTSSHLTGEVAISGIGEALLPVGKAVATRVAGAWLARRKADSRRGHSLTELIQAQFPLRRSQRPLLDALVELEDHVAEQLSPMLVNLAYELPEDERDAALISVSNALENSHLSNDMLFRADLNADELAFQIRNRNPEYRVTLSSRAAILYDLALERACVIILHYVRELPEFNAAIAVETLKRLTGVVIEVEKSLERLPVRSLDAPAGSDYDNLYCSRYLEEVAELYNHLEVVGLTTHHYEPTTTLTVAYLSMSVTDELEGRISVNLDRHAGMDKWHRKPIEHGLAENLRVEAALCDSQRTLIRGEAGAGKSTLLRWLAINAARQTFKDYLTDWNGCVPILVKLREFAEKSLPLGDDLLRQSSSPQCGPIPEEWVHRQLLSGRVLLLVDGVDELTSQQRDKARSWLRSLLSAYKAIRVVVTSRPTAVTPKWLLRENFRSVVLEPMNAADVQIFLSRWHQALLTSMHNNEDLLPCRPEEVHDHERALLAQLKARAHLRSLVRNPLLCAMLCALNLDRRARLPQDRLTLYSAALDMLLERRDADRGVTAMFEVSLTASEKSVLLRVLAWWLNENNRTQMSHDQALCRFRERLQGMRNVSDGAEAVLNHLLDRSGIIRQPILGKVDFVHRTFQEFLAAKEAVDRDSIDLLVNKASSDLWRETVIMACAHASPEQRGRLLGGILDRAEKSSRRIARQLRLLVAACRETAILAPVDVLDRIDACVESLLPPRNQRESRSLATVGETILGHLPANTEALSPAQAAACFHTAALVNGPKALDLLARYASDSRPEVQREATASWRYFDAELYASKVLKNAPLGPFRGKNGGYLSLDFVSAVPYLKLLSNLTCCDLHLWGEESTDSVCVEVSKLSKLVDLGIFCDDAPASLVDLGRLEELRSITLSFRRQWPQAVDFLATLIKLESLTLAGVPENMDLSCLKQLQALRILNISTLPLASYIKKIANPSALRQLNACHVESRDELKALVEKFSNLDILWLTECSSLADLTPLMDLRCSILALSHCPNIDLAGLVDHPTLRWITLDSMPQEVDVSPLANSKLVIAVNPDVEIVGFEQMGSGVRFEGMGFHDPRND